MAESSKPDPADVPVRIRHKYDLSEKTVSEAALPGFVNADDPDDDTKPWEVVTEKKSAAASRTGSKDASQ